MKKISAIGIILFVITTSVYAQNRRTSTVKKVSEPVKKTATVKDKNPEIKEEQKEETTATPISTKPTKNFLSPSSEAWKMSTLIELGALPSDADITFINIYGHLGLNFDLGRRFHVGSYFRNTIMNTHEYQVLPYEGISYDASTFKEWGAGLSVGAYFPLGTTLLLNPELRIGYNEFTIQSVNFDSTNNNFIYRNYINFTPKMNFGFKLSDYTILNLNGGYNFPMYLGNSDLVPHYNPGSFMYGLGIRFYLMK